MEINEILERVRQNNPNSNVGLIEKAYHFAREKHDGQLRKDGSPYIIHPLAVAETLAGLRLDSAAIASALLHDTVEDTSATLEEIKENFGEEVAALVDGVTKLTALSEGMKPAEKTGKLSTISMMRAENLRKIFLAMGKDIRVILIKLADRLHNMSTIRHLPPHKQKEIARETLEIYAPIASRLGMWGIKSVMEDLAFKCLEPRTYYDLEKRVKARISERQMVIDETIATLKAELDKHLIKYQSIEGRAKHIHSIYEKITRRGVDFEDIFDLVAVRIIVDSVEECYAALGVVHSIWIPFMNRLKDYIGSPKPNGYRSIHTVVYSPSHIPVEIQIRTREMHQMNEYGIASHWAYKEGKKVVNLAKDIYPWIRHLLDWETDSRDAKDYVENLKLDLLKEEIFVFTPKGDVIDLPAGSTPLDFAYRIHTEVGNHTLSAKVNGNMAPLSQQLQNSDVVEIVTAKKINPSLDWLRLCKSRHTKNKIRAWFKKERLPESIERGRDLLLAEFRKVQLEEFMEDKKVIAIVIRKLGFTRFEELLGAIGYGEVTVNQVLHKYKEALPSSVGEVLLPSPRRKAQKKTGKTSPMVQIEGLEGDGKGMLVTFSRCCSPIPGDQVVGYVTLGKGISLHRINCPNLAYLQKSPERVLKVSWAGVPDRKFSVEIRVDAWDRNGLIADIMNVINKLGVPALSCGAKAQDRMAKVQLELQVGNLEELNQLFEAMSRIKGCLQVCRTTRMVRGGRKA